MNEILVLGEAPSRRTDGGPPLSGACGDFLAELVGSDLRDAFDVENLLDEWPGPAKHGKGSSFPMAIARRRVRDPLFVEKVARYDRVIVLGRRVWRALGLPNDTPWLGWAIPTRGFFAGIEFSLLPHPSRVNRVWNDRKFRERAAKALRELREEVPA